MSVASLDAAASVVLTMALHASVALALAWLAQHTVWRRQPQRAALGWRIAATAALLGALAGATPATSDRTLPAPAASAGLAAANVATAAPSSTLAAATAAGPKQRMGGRGAAPPPAAAAPRSERWRPAPIRLPWASSWQRWLACAWLAGLLLVLARLLGARRQLPRPRWPAPPPLQLAADRVAAALGTAPARVFVDPAIASPLALPGRRILLPGWACTLPAADTEALLAHELWHLARRDPLWRLLDRLLLAPLWFHPLAWQALRQLDALSERSCDAAAARLQGSGAPLARCLAACLVHAAGRPPLLAPAMSRPAGAVARRVQSLLQEPAIVEPTAAPFRVRAAALALALAAAIVLPAVTVSTAIGAQDHARSITVLEDGSGRRSVDAVLVSDGTALVIKMEGVIEFAADEADVASMADGALLDISEERDGVKRRVRFAGEDGDIVRQAWLGDAPVEWDAGTRAWVARLLPEVFRGTGIDAEARARRLLADGGPPALLAEIEAIEHGDVRADYLALLLAQPLPAADFSRALTLAAAIGSDHSLRRVLQAALDSPSLAAQHREQLLRMSTHIDSDFERAELLVGAAPLAPADAALLPAWREALDGIDSDFERRRVLQSLLAADASPATVALVLEQATGIGSDFEARQVLESTVGRLGADPQLHRAWHRLLGEVDSHFERRVALEALLAASPRPLPHDTTLQVLDAVAGIDSDFEALQVLLAVARVMPDDAALVSRYRAVARPLADHERGQAERALDRLDQAR